MGKEVIEFLKKQNEFKSVREIAEATDKTVQSVNNQVNRMTPYFLKKKVKKVKVGNRNSKYPVSFYKYKTEEMITV